MKPILIYVDDEPRNLTVFEASIPDEWEARCYDSAIEALKELKEIKPWVILSDQKMPRMTGLEFLEVASQLVPDAVRIVVTGQTEEQTIIELVRRAKIFDYLTKPWDTEVLLNQLSKAIEYYRVFVERNQAVELLKAKNQELEIANAIQLELKNEIGAWTPAAIVWAIQEKTLVLPATRHLVGITYDIVQSSALAGKMVNDRSVKSHVLTQFTQCLMKMGGLKESSSGDSVYGHFGAVAYPPEPHLAAFRTAEEFKVSLQSFSKLHKIKVECGIALHDAPGTLVQMHEARAETPKGSLIQKWVDTESAHVDGLHRMEKIVHDLPGTNIIMSEGFLQRLLDTPPHLVKLGNILLKGQPATVTLYLIPSQEVTPEQLAEFRKKYFFEEDQKAA